MPINKKLILEISSPSTELPCTEHTTVETDCNYCGSDGYIYSEIGGDEQRIPCPNCGGTKKLIATITVSFSQMSQPDLH